MKDQKHRTSPVTILALVVIVGILIGLCPCSFSCSSEHARRVACMNNLSAIGKALVFHAEDHGGAVSELLQITKDANNPRLFVCPSSGHKAGALPSVDKWSDYTLVSGIGTGRPSHVVVAFCRPANHGGNGGNILFDDGSVQWLNFDEYEKRMRSQQSAAPLPSAPTGPPEGAR